MEYITYKRFKGKGIGGEFNLAYGTRVTEYKGFLFTQEGRCICASSSENGWGHFRPATEIGAHRQAMLEDLYRCFERGEGDLNDLLKTAVTSETRNFYWRDLLRKLPTDKLERVWRENIRQGGRKCIRSSKTGLS